MPTSGHAITTLVVFIVSVFFVIRPVTIPTPPPMPRIPINLITAPFLAIVSLWAVRSLDLEVIRNGTVGTEDVKPYNILILSFSLAYVSMTLDITGIPRAVAFWVSNKGGQSGLRVHLFLYLMLSLLSILLGNDSAILSGTEFLVHFTEASRLEARPWVTAEFAAVNIASMVLFVGNPTNLIICEAFGVDNAAFTTYTILPFLACNVLCFAASAIQYRDQVLGKLPRTIHVEPQRAILDHIGAWVGSLVLGAILILSLLCSLFRKDAWKISLPFAVIKLLFDLGWDHYRHVHCIPMLGRKSAKDVKKADSAQRSMVTDRKREQFTLADEASTVLMRSEIQTIESETEPLLRTAPEVGTRIVHNLRWYQTCLDDLHDRLDRHFPTFITALPRLPFVLIPYIISQFILIEALDHQGWVNVFSRWLIRASGKRVQPTIWIVGVLEVILSSVLGTNISATILLSRVVRAAALPCDANRGAAIALAVASNTGAVGITFSASLWGRLWRAILEKNNIHVTQRDVAFRNLLRLLLMMTVVGLGVVSAEMAVLFRL